MKELIEIVVFDVILLYCIKLMKGMATIGCAFFVAKVGGSMNERQKRFADEYLIDLNAEQAAIRAGYSEKYARGNAHKLVANSCIAEYIKKRMAEKEKSLIADQDEVLRYLTSVLRGESQSTEIVVEGCGDGISEARKIQKEPSEKDRLKAAELLGKRYGLYTDRVETEVDISPIVIRNDVVE